MNSAVVCFSVLALFVLGYRFYSRWLAERVFQLDDDRPTPAVATPDGVDYVQTPRGVLFGHHFSSIAGAAPIVGPAVAVIWGWVPAMLWIGLGVLFAGAVHDMGALVISARHGGRTIGDVTASVIGPRSRSLFLLIIFFLTTMVLAVFAYLIGSLFVKFPGSILPVNVEIPVAALVGWLAWKKKFKLLIPSLIVLAGLYGLIWIGAETAGTAGEIQAALMGDDPQQQIFIWCILLLIYSFVASVLPVWLLLQPRDFINSHQLVVGLAGLILGVAIVQAPIVAPAFHAPADGPAWWPVLFVTIACGAVSGFHGLVSSGTTSKQIARESDARAIGYGGMLGEGVLATLATLAVATGFPDTAAWSEHYHSWDGAKGLASALGAFVTGSALFLEGLGIPTSIGQVVMAVLVISFAATSLDTATRIQRFVIQELADIYDVPPLKNRYAAGALAVGLALALLVSASPNGPGSGGLILWPLFGAGNQLLAALTLLVITIWLKKLGRNYAVTLIPMLFLGVITTFSMVANLQSFYEASNWLLLTIAALIAALEVWIVIEGIGALRGGGPAEQPAK